MMLVGVTGLLDSKPFDMVEDIALSLLMVGALVYAGEPKEHRRIPPLGGQYGTRGPYKTNRTQEFIDSIIDQNSDRFFKMWFR